MDTQVTAIARGNATRADAPKLTAPKSFAPAWKAIAPIAMAVVLALAPAPPGLPQHAWFFFSIFVGVIVGLVLEPLPGAPIAIIGITVVAVLAPFVLFSPQQLSAPGFRPPSAALNWALSGYSNATVWLIFGAFILALGYERTGLGERIALLLVKRMGKNSLLLGYGVTLADTILAPFIPSPMLYVSVADCDERAAKAKQLGGAVCVPPFDIPNVGRIAILSDAQGAFFSLVHLTAMRQPESVHA